MTLTREECFVSAYQSAARLGIKTELTLMAKDDFDRLSIEERESRYELAEVFSSHVLVKVRPDPAIAE